MLSSSLDHPKGLQKALASFSCISIAMLLSPPQLEGSTDTSTASKVAGVGKWAAQGAQSVARSAKNAVTGTDEAQETHSPAGAMQQRCGAQTSLPQNERLPKRTQSEGAV
jgi:hypothetical protein